MRSGFLKKMYPLSEDNDNLSLSRLRKSTLNLLWNMPQKLKCNPILQFPLKCFLPFNFEEFARNIAEWYLYSFIVHKSQYNASKELIEKEFWFYCCLKKYGSAHSLNKQVKKKSAWLLPLFRLFFKENRENKAKLKTFIHGFQTKNGNVEFLFNYCSWRILQWCQEWALF